jgi:hypothetical protein
MSTPGDDDTLAYQNLEREMNTPDPETDHLLPSEPEPYREPERQQYHEPEIHDRTAGRQQEHYQPAPRQPEVPDMHDDPVGHFGARANIAEQALSHMYNDREHERFWKDIESHEARARAEIGEDYDAACDHAKNSRMAELYQQFPDGSHQAQAVAHQYGYPSAAHLREAVLRNDIITVAQHAYRTGVSPAQAFYSVAQQRGFRPSVTVGRSQERAVADLVKYGNDRDADGAWDWYVKQMKKAEDR